MSRVSPPTPLQNVRKSTGKCHCRGKKKPTLLIFLEQFKDFLVIILIIAALISAFTGDLRAFWSSLR